MGTRDEDFTRFFTAEAERLRRIAFFMTGDIERAADLAQDALAATYRHWHRISGADAGPYARRTLVNMCRNSRRRGFVERRHAAAVRRDDRVEPRSIEETMRIVSALRELSPTQRAVVVLRYYEDLSEAEISRVLDRPLGTIKSDLFRALRKLRPLLDEQEVS